MNEIARLQDKIRMIRFRETRMRRHLRCGEDGQSMIEFALCLPPLLILMTGIFTFGIAIANYIQLTNAAGMAGVQLSISRLTLDPAKGYDPCSMAVGVVQAAAPMLAPGNLKYAFVLNGTSYPTGGTPATSVTCPSTSEYAGAAGNLVSGQPVTVTVTYPCSLAIFKSNNFPSCVLTARSSELVQ
jgi:Flp pilus assembly protein TadG